MTLAGGAHIKLGDYEFHIDKSMEGSYVHRFYDLTAEKVQIAGTNGKEQLLPDTMMWTLDDWAGGEGSNIFYQEQFDTYHSSGALNGRIRGQLTGRPARTRSASSGDSYGGALKDQLFVAGGKLNRVKHGGRFDYLDVNTLTWTQWDATFQNIESAAGTSSYVYAFSNAANKIYRVVNGSAEVSYPHTQDHVGAGFLEGKLYGWTGAHLKECDVNDWANWDTDHYRKVYDAGDVPAGTWGSAWYGDVTSTENSVIFWRSASGISEMFEFRNGVGYPLWVAPQGFTLRSTCYQNGIVYMAGHWGDEGEGWGALYALPLDSLRPVHLKWIGRLNANHYSMPHIAGSYGNQILLASGQTHVYVYDTETDGLTVLDSNSSDNYRNVATMGGYRYVMGANYMYKFDDDEPGEREAGFNTTDFTDLADQSVLSSKYDFDFPMETKSLIAFHVAMEPMAAGQTIDISYQLDGQGWTSLTQIDAGTSGALTGRVAIPIATGASTPTFYQLQVKVELGSSTSVLSPILYSVTVEAKLARKREEWELIVRLKDEQEQQRPTHRRVYGDQLRDWLLNTVNTGAALTFLDGYRYKNEGTYSTHTVTVKEVADLIDEEGEGSCRLLLTATTEAT